MFSSFNNLFELLSVFELSSLFIYLEVLIVVVIPPSFRAFNDVDNFRMFLPYIFNIIGNYLNYHFENINV